ncbi:MAG: hypothetical protein ACFFDK_12650 [Promethearchaeota archaeon]
MTNARFIISVIVGISLSFVSVALFTMWESLYQLNSIFKSSFLRGLAMLLGTNFSFNIIAFVTKGQWAITYFFAPALLGWIFVGYITGTIAKGSRNGVISGLLAWVIVLLIWILISIIAGEDLMAFFQGNQLFMTLGGIGGSCLGVSLSSAVGGFISGPQEEY